ncbi:uncharacterized protein LOC118437995 [Folsomia candida]|uniref:uncharacterized protein LOC118437995 n=1 Tax=Folsomia candida TaxID=158441 RepID=UPI001604A77B|nr:uncharacterized protein LOC118437995 [Folsomia candida]
MMNVFNFRDKKMTNTDWRIRDLTQRQQAYAAKDAYYTLRIFYSLYDKLGLDGVKKAVLISSKKLIVNPSLRKFDVKKPLSHDAITDAIIDWRKHLALNLDWQPEQILPFAQITNLSVWLGKQELTEVGADIVQSKVVALGMKANYKSADARLLQFLNPTEKDKMNTIQCRNCGEIGHIGLSCPFSPDKEKLK